MKILRKQKQIISQINKEKDLRRYASLSKEELFTIFNTSEKGLEEEQVIDHKEKYGENVFERENRHNILSRLGEALFNPFNIILLIIALVTYFTDVVIGDNQDYITIIILLFMVLLSSLVSFIQSRNSDKAAENLKQMVANTCHVYRQGSLIEIDISQLVAGDIIKLSAGDMLPADVRFIQTKDTFISQSALTGESQPIERFAIQTDDETIGLTDLPNIALLGSDIVSGSALAIAVHTGVNTYFSSIAESLNEKRAPSSFEAGVSSVSKMLIQMMIFIIPIIFLINGLIKGDWMQALLFSVSIAVGLTPEMLPVIMTTTLARGAVEMSKHKVIVRDLGSIQTFGEMNMLCTDKTGTLTEDKIVLERYMDITGQDDKRILRHAFLNSYFQTGLKNLIDIAIINRAESYNLQEILENYKTVDEVPFDFARRRMSVVLEDTTGKRQLITKGAVEEMLSICSYLEIDGKVVPLGEKEKEIANKTYLKHNKEGLRMIAVAQKNKLPEDRSFSVKDEKDMVLIGFVGFLDPPKESAKEAIDTLKNHGVKTVVLTGDSEGVAINVCNKIGIDVKNHYTGTDVENMDDKQLRDVVEDCQLFSKLSPIQKQRVVEAMQDNGHTVGYMGDGINDTPALRQADVGISVDSAVDIAKETADIILLEKDLMVLEEGVLEGRKTFGNVMKYIKMAVSGNFGNMIAVVFASIFLPFLPMLPVHILTQNLLNDFAQMGIAFDRVDEEYIEKPKKWDVASIKKFMGVLGPLSSIFDILCFLALWFIMGYNSHAKVAYFQAGWFLFGTLSQILIIFMIRTGKTPFFKSKPARNLVILSLTIGILALVIAFTPLAIWIDLKPISYKFIPILVVILGLYVLAVEVVKKKFKKVYGEWI